MTRLGAAIIATLLLPAPLHADIQYMVDYLLPRGGGRGATVEVTFRGRSLENPREILFYQPGIKASGFEPLAKPGDGFKTRFQIAADCPLGEHVLRVRTATALSDAVTFWVSRFPTVYELETKIGENDSIAKAKAVPMNSTVEGQILPGPEMDRDFYRVEAKEGQRISVEVESARLGTLHFGGENDLMARILDASGKEIGKDDDSSLYVQDPVLSVIAPRTGSYFIEIRQQIFTPPRQAWYRAHIGSFSRPTAIFPAGGEAGSMIDLRILGDPAGERTEHTTLPEKSGNFDYFAGSPAERPPSPNVLRVSPCPNVLWSGSANTPATLPAALNGILDKAGEQHTYQFAAKKGQAWKVQVFARSLGAPVDAKIWIRSVKDPKHILDADDARMVDLGLPSSRGNWHIKDQLDPVAIFRPPADGEYILGIEDGTNAAGPDHVYRVEIEPLHDAIYTHITAPDGYQMPRLTALVVPRENRWTVDVQLAQGLGNSYKGDLELEARGLPPGVSMIAPRVAKGANRVPVQFVAAPDAEPKAALIELLAKPVDAKAPVESGSRQAFALTNQPGELPWHFVFLDRYALAVTDPAPFHLELEQPGIPLAQSSELQLKVKVVRHGDFKGAIEMQPDWLPPGVSKGATVTIPADKTEATFTIQANDKAAPGVYQVAMNASTSGVGDGYSGVGRVRVSSPFVELKVAEPYLTIDLGRSSVEQGKSGEIVGTVKQNHAFPGKATVTLRQLPKGVKLQEPAPQITSKDSAIVFHVSADSDALAGLYKGIGCEIAFTEDGQTIRQQTGSGVLRVDAARTVTQPASTVQAEGHSK
ncbi:MAG TPA: PPC domain-containing protein [Bryobacteraceae bacterium]|nr:PPC domain-containing protein [Bryobacteraceae bacterium]